MLKPFSDKVANLAPSAIREILKFTADPEVISFAAGNPAPEAFPVDTIAKISADIFREEPITALQYSVTEGYPKLRTWLEQDLRKKKLFKDGDMVVVTSGAQQAIEVTTKILCNEGDVILCENPSFIGSLNAFRSYGVKLIGVPMDEDGNLSTLSRISRTPRVRPQLLNAEKLFLRLRKSTAFMCLRTILTAR